MTRAKWSGDVAQVAEHLSNKFKVLHSNHSTAKKKEEIKKYKLFKKILNLRLTRCIYSKLENIADRN
jgi:hypothetical protein